ncbi:ATP-binding cassette domain-containing protein [Achromobacter sp. Marseille-Q0513]|uniref:ABC transporter ATP-binding protein n=1 Tax=Achromobacter sp. Marseille-Q0513 TaxID=2829161 RepID=UPI001B8F24F7|nr:ATP-binding cassette domain-containing protein [Achromobacter sp. Marseille-Q0513]MBR8656415.1 ATP-binding cassette domain-containing protein [Achromobacter sp. Marseille-Q0513]
MTALLEVRGLTCGYGGGIVLDRLSLTLEPGKVMALIGRNGVGKTTLMRALIGLLPATAGDILLNGSPLSALPPDARARAGIGYVPQGREIFTALTVRENLLVGMSAAPAAAPSALEAVLDYFPVLRARLGQRAGTMSGGEQQQLAIARALASSPRLLLLDEPSEGVQPSIVDLIARTLARIAASTGIGVLLVEQDIGMVQQAADRCAVMDKGRIVNELDREQIADMELMRRQLAL